MKKLTIAVMLLGTLMLSTAAASAQSYEGTSLEDGIFYVPANVGPGSVINFAASGFVPNSEVSITLLDANQNDAGDIQVAGALVIRADAAGNVNVDIRLPANIGAGVLTLRVDGTRSDNTAFSSTLAIEISPAAVANPTLANESPSALAFTGSDSPNRVLGGVLLVAAGLALVVVASQRRSASSDA